MGLLGAGGAATVVMRRPDAPAQMPPTVVVAPSAADERPREISERKADSMTTPVETPRVSAPPLTGRLRVRAFPADAEISVDGQLLGRGVVLDSTIRVGTRRLRVSAPGYKSFDTTITVVADEITALARIALPAQDPE
jgi:hypothetical protein